MAIPPEPIDEILPLADAAVIAEVTRVLEQEPYRGPAAQPGFADLPGDAPRQVVELKVEQPLFGQVSTGLITVIKPAGDYALMAGNRGPFLLGAGNDARLVIVGRYGPDTYRRETIEAARARQQKT